MYYGIKQVKEFKNKDSILYKLVNEYINDILNDPIDHESFDYVLLPNFLKDDKYLEIYYVVAIATMILLLMVYL